MSHHSIEQVKASVRIEDVVRRRGVYLRISQGGERLEGHCPFHALDETPSFNLYVTSQRYHCFGCGANGDVIDFVQAWDVCSFQEAVQRLTGKIVALPTVHLARTTRPVLPVPLPLEIEKNHTELLTRVQQHYHQALLMHRTLKQELLRARGITEEGIACCSLGYADGSFAPLIDTPEMQQEAQKIGLLGTTQWERLWMRLILPECVDGQCIWMIGRTVYQPLQGKRGRKYLGLSLSKPLLGYGLALARIRERRLIRAILVVEGAIDYVIASQWDLPVVCVALVGTHASMRQLVMLLDLQQKANMVPLLISLDADAAGRQASAHLLTQLQQRTAVVHELAPITGVKDIGDLGIHPEGYSLLHTSIEQTLSALQGELQ